MRTALLWTFVFSFIAHGYRWFNAGFSHDSLAVLQHGNLWQVSIGRFLVPFYLMFRGKIAIPWLIAILSVAFLSLSIVLIVKLLGIKRQLHIVLLCGVLSTCPTLIALHSTYIQWADIQMLSLLFSVISVWLAERYKRGWIAAGVSFAISLALYQSYSQAAVTLVLLMLIKGLLTGETYKSLANRIGRSAGFMALGGALYLIIWKVVKALTSLLTGLSVDSTGSYNSLSRIGEAGIAGLPSLVWNTYLSFLEKAFYPNMLNYKIVFPVALFVVVTAVVLMLRKSSDWRRLSLTVLALLLLPLGAHFVYILTNGMMHELMIFPVVLLSAGVLMVLDWYKEDVPGVINSFKIAAVAGLCFLTFNNTVYANQCHVKKVLEEQATLSVMTRLLYHIESVDGYEPGQTPIVLVGDLNRSSIKQDRIGYETVKTVVGTGNNFSITYFESFHDYFRYILAYPVNFVFRDESLRFNKMPEVLEMPSFPHPGCAKMVGDTLVVRLSEDISRQSVKEHDLNPE